MSSPQATGGTSVKYSQQYRRCGRAQCASCTPPGRGHGPYWYAYWWEEGRVRSRYLGKHLPSAEPALYLMAAPATAGTLRVRALGGFAVWRSGELVPASQWGRRKVAALFKCLLSAPGHRLHREQVLDYLFPESGPAEAAKGLRSTIYLLRKVLDVPEAPASHLQSQGEWLALVPMVTGDPDGAWLDVRAFEQAAATALAGREIAACRTALSFYGGEYLPDDRYEDWAERRREELAGQHLALLLHLADLHLAAGEVEEGLGCLRTVLAAEPCHEEAARLLMEALAAHGRRGEALDVYRTLATALERELEVPPSPEIQAARTRLLAEAPISLVPVVRRTNLPARLTSFVGREWERSEITRALHEEVGGCRLVSLVGAGGCGKTQLALEVARGLLEEYPDGVWLVELAVIADSDLLAQAVASTLGLREQAGQTPHEGLVSFLATRRMLLLLDNCEHLLASCAALVVTLLKAAPGLRVLATSQASLEVLGEVVWRVPALALPPRDELPAAEVVAYEAVQLLLERARAAAPRFVLTDRNAPAVARICRRLDGIPLALELAAPRLATLSPETLAGRLDDRFALLSGGNRAALPRQQTLRATIEWSYSLLPGEERLLLGRLAIFAGGWTLAAVEAICAGVGLSRTAVLARLERLVARSLVQADEAGEEMRYRLLESVRAFAWEQAEAAGELDTVRARHLEWCLALAEANAISSGPGQAEGLAKLEREHDNLRAALGWAADRGGGEAGLRLAGKLWWFWASCGHLSEGRRWLEATLAGAAAAPHALRAHALHGAGVLARNQGDYDQAIAHLTQALAAWRELGHARNMARTLGNLGIVAYRRSEYGRASAFYEEALAVYRELGDKFGIGAWLNNLGLVLYEQGEYDRAAALYQESLALQREVGDTLGIAGSLGNLGEIAHTRGQYDHATALYEEALALQRQLGDKVSIAISLGNLGDIACLQEEYGRAEALIAESLALQRELGDKQSSALSLGNLGEVAYRQGDYERAAALYEEGLRLSRDIGARDQQAEGLERIAWLAVARDEPLRAARLGGAGEALRDALGMPLTPAQRAGHEIAVQALRETLGDPACAAAWAEGRTLPLDEAMALALEGDLSRSASR